jgi:DnaJ-domain-containing protein 1
MIALEQHLLEILSAHPDGIGEHALIKALQSADHKGITGASLTNPIELFRANFLLFHALYRLRERLWQEERGHLEINMLRIVLQPYRRGVAALAGRDPLRDYYLDLNNLKATTEEDVVALLAGFWKRLQANEQRAVALAVLELSDPIDYDTIKKQYRMLAMQHHPDRGGDKKRLQAINHAMAILEACHRNA